MEISESHLRGLYDYEAENVLVSAALREAGAELPNLFQFLVRYASWNGYFGSAVASLAGKIGRSRGLFLSADSPFAAIADRSVLVASYFFDAARDEFDDRETLHRDTHRCLAQSTLQGVVDYAISAKAGAFDDAHINKLTATPVWLSALNERVAAGYGVGSADTLPVLFRCMGYHVGSEVLADQEFSVIDQTLTTEQPELHKYLSEHSVVLGGETHGCYQWIGLHSGHGGGAEADHFEWAMQGVKKAFSYVEQQHHEDLLHQFDLGFLAFASDHSEFFTRVNQ